MATIIKTDIVTQDKNQKTKATNPTPEQISSWENDGGNNFTPRTINNEIKFFITISCRKFKLNSSKLK